MPRLKVRVLTEVLLCGMTAGAPAVAQASSTNVVAAIKTQDKAIKSSAADQNLQHFDAKTTAQAKALIPKFAALESKAKHAATVVAAASTSSAQQKQGQTDWVDGTREVARGIGQFETGIKDLVAGNKSTAKAAVTKAEKTLDAGNALSNKGDKLLGLPTKD